MKLLLQKWVLHTLHLSVVSIVSSYFMAWLIWDTLHNWPQLCLKSKERSHVWRLTNGFPNIRMKMYKLDLWLVPQTLIRTLLDVTRLHEHIHSCLSHFDGQNNTYNKHSRKILQGNSGVGTRCCVMLLYKLIVLPPPVIEWGEVVYLICVDCTPSCSMWGQPRFSLYSSTSLWYCLIIWKHCTLQVDFKI